MCCDKRKKKTVSKMFIVAAAKRKLRGNMVINFKLKGRR
jgi:hypothetical protein